MPIQPLSACTPNPPHRPHCTNISVMLDEPSWIEHQANSISSPGSSKCISSVGDAILAYSSPSRPPLPCLHCGLDGGVHEAICLPVPHMARARHGWYTRPAAFAYSEEPSGDSEVISTCCIVHSAKQPPLHRRLQP